MLAGSTVSVMMHLRQRGVGGGEWGALDIQERRASTAHVLDECLLTGGWRFGDAQRRPVL